MAAKAKIRKATLSDFEGIAAVCGRNGMPIGSRAGWERLWTDYPFRDEFAEVPIGWVLEGQRGEITGTISSLHFVYEFQGRRLKVAAAGNWAVDAAYRSSSLLLGAQFYRQENLDFLINGSTSKVAAQLMPLYKAQRIPSPDFDNSLIWIASPHKVAASALSRRNIPGAALLGYPSGAVLWARDTIKRSGRGPIRSRIEEIKEFDARFDEFWLRRSSTAKQLIAVRSQALLDWRFGRKLELGLAAVFTLERDDGMVGYVILNRRDRAGLKNYQVADLQVLTRNPVDVQDLLLAGIERARKDGVDLIEMQGFNAFKRNAAIELKPHHYRYPVWQAFYKVMDPRLREPLERESTWDVSPFDSD